MLVKKPLQSSEIFNLFIRIDASLPHMNYLKIVMNDSELFRNIQKRLCSWVFNEYVVDGSDMRRELITWAFNNPTVFKGITWLSPIAPPEAIEFFKSCGSNELLAFITKRTECIPRSLPALAAATIVSRSPYGSSLLQNHASVIQYITGSILARHSSGYQPQAVEMMFSHDKYFASNLHELLEDAGSAEYADMVCNAICNYKPYFKVTAFLDRYLNYEISEFRPISAMRLLKHATAEQLRLLVELNPSLVTNECAYYKPRLSQIFADAGVLERLHY
jgi:hypothetical protein